MSAVAAEDLEQAEQKILRLARRERWLRRVDRAAILLAIVIWPTGFFYIQADQAGRRDQNCIAFERQERTAVNQLERTREFLSTKPTTRREREIQRQFGPLAREQLPRLKEDVRANRAPEYCDEPAVGLAEP